MNIDLFLLCFSYGLISVIFLLDIINILRKSKYISMYLICKIMFFIIDGMVPLILHIKYYLDRTLDDWNIYLDYSKEGINALMVTSLLSLLGYIFITLGYRNKYKIVVGKNNTEKYKNISGKKSSLKFLRYIAIITLIISVVALFMWTKAYGGVIRFIIQANAIRSGNTDIINSYSFFKYFTRMILIPSYSFFVINIFSKKRKTLDIMLLFISVIFSVCFLLASDGRMTAGFYFITYAIVYMQCRRKTLGKRMETKTIIKIGIAVLIVLLFMLKMDDLTFYIRNGFWDGKTAQKSHNLISSFIYELSFVVVSEQMAVMKSGEIGLQILNDIGYGFFAWLPSSLIPSIFPRLWTLNTNLSGAISGELPCGIIAQGYYDLNILGVVIFPYMYGRIIKKIDALDVETPYDIIIYSLLFYSIVRIVSYGMIYDFVQGIFNVFVFVIFYHVFSRLLNKGTV